MTDQTHLGLIRANVRAVTPGARIFLYGSRVKGNHRPGSDLDVAVLAEQALSLRELGEINAAFEESDLPFVVDVHDYRRFSTQFKSIIGNSLMEV